MSSVLVYKIETQEAWDCAEESGVYHGSALDHKDGFIHLSTIDQVRTTLALHFAGRDGLVLIAVDPANLGTALVMEPSRGGQLFPHLYGPLPIALCEAVLPLTRDAGGAHVLPAGFP